MPTAAAVIKPKLKQAIKVLSLSSLFEGDNDVNGPFPSCIVSVDRTCWLVGGWVFPADNSTPNYRGVTSYYAYKVLGFHDVRTPCEVVHW